MAKIGFIGLGHMGGPMAENLLKGGHEVHVFDLVQQAIETAVQAGAIAASDAFEAAENKDFVITMLPESQHVQSVYLGDNGLISKIKKPTFFLECSTIDVSVARDLHEKAAKVGHRMLDAPVSGGVTGAKMATLTFMVGGKSEDFKVAKSLFEVMGKHIFHAGAEGNGQAVKICNNLMLAVHMIVTSEAFILGEKLGLNKKVLFDVASTSSGQSWSLTSYCPVPGLVTSSPANRNYEAGFTAAMMLKDLTLAYKAAQETDTELPLGFAAQTLYKLFCKAEKGSQDFSGIINYIRDL